MRSLAIFFVMAAMTTVAWAVGDDDASKADLKKMQGKWKVVKHFIGGQEIPFPNPATIAGDKLSFNSLAYYQMTLNAKDTPKAFDCNWVYGNKLRKKGLKAIYGFDGDDKLKIFIVSNPTTPRPTAFESKKGEDGILYFLERMKE